MNAMLRPADTPLGVFYDLPEAEYHRRYLDEASNSGLTRIARSPLHYWHWVNHPEDDEESDTLVEGKALHCAVLEPAAFGDRYVVLPADAPADYRRYRNASKQSDSTKASIAWWDTWDLRCAGRTTLPAQTYDDVRAMGQILRGMRLKFPKVTVLAGELFDACQKEVTLRCVDEETGIVCKARLDLFEPDLHFGGDLKSTFDASEESFARSIARYRYHVQHCHYSECARLCGLPLKSFAFFAVEKKRPFAPASWHIGAASEQLGWDLREASLRRLQRCLASDEWPSYTDTVKQIEVPTWAHYRAGDSE